MKLLLLADEKQSSINQLKALSKQLQKSKKNLLIFSKIISREWFHFLPNIIIFLILKIKYYYKKDEIRDKFQVIISCGRISAPYNLIMKKFNNSFNLHILNPYFHHKSFDRIILPEHDNFNTLENIIFMKGSLVDIEKLNISEDKVRNFKKKINLKKKVIAVLLGGSGRSSVLRKTDLEKPIKFLNSLKCEYEIVYCFSRRTPEKIKEFIKKEKKDTHHIFESYENDSYRLLMKYAHSFLITEDSISMTSEVISSGKPVYIIKVRKIKKKISLFQDSIMSLGFTRYLKNELDIWSYKPLNETKRISEIITNLLV